MPRVVAANRFLIPISTKTRIDLALSLSWLSVITSSQILTHQRAGTGSPIGQRLLASPDSRLLIGSASTSSPEESTRVQALLDRCGSFDSKQRPLLQQVLHEVDSISAAANDRAVLVEALLGLMGSSERTKSWHADRNISEWDGVIVTDIGRVSCLEARDFDLSGERTRTPRGRRFCILFPPVLFFPRTFYRGRRCGGYSQRGSSQFHAQRGRL